MVDQSRRMFEEPPRDESFDEKQVVVAKLEARNREMMKEILRLRREVSCPDICFPIS